MAGNLYIFRRRREDRVKFLWPDELGISLYVKRLDRNKFISYGLVSGFECSFDDCSRECLALVAYTSLSGTRVTRELNRLVMERGRPNMVVNDNRSEFSATPS